MAQKPSWTPWHRVVKLRDDMRTGELSLTAFAADLDDVIMQKGTRPLYEDPASFFALTYPTHTLRDLAKDVVLRLAGRSTKAIRQLQLTYGGGKTHTLITLRHLVHDPASLPRIPAIATFESHIGVPLPTARIAALSFDKIDVDKGMEVRGPDGELRWLKNPWSIIAYQLAGTDGLKSLHAQGKDAERETPPAEPLLAALLKKPQADGRSTLVLVDEVLMYARQKVAIESAWRSHLINFFLYLCQAVAKVDRCALVASLLAADTKANDPLGREILLELSEIFGRQQEEGVQPVKKEDVAEVLRRRFFEQNSINAETFRPHVITAVGNIAELDEATRKDQANAERRLLGSYPFHPDLTDIFYARWTELPSFQRTRGILRTFAIALRDAEKWDNSPLVGPSVFLAKPETAGLSEAAAELAGIATQGLIEGRGNNWSSVLDTELEKARTIEKELPGLKGREIEQAVASVFLSSQPIGQKARTPEVLALVGTTRPDRIELEKGLRRWTELSWFLDEAEYATDEATNGAPKPLPKAWRLGNQPNLKQMHHDACNTRVTPEEVESQLLTEVRQAKDLTRGAQQLGVHVHTLPERPRDIENDGEFHLAILGPKAASESGKPSAEARRFIDETTAADRPRTCRNAIVLVAPSRDGLEAVRARIREYVGWVDVRRQLDEQQQSQDVLREERLANWTAEARKAIPEAIRQAWSIIVTVNEKNDIQAFKVTVGAEPLFATVKGDPRSRIKDAAVSAEAILPGGPYDLWRPDEPSRRVKDLVSAFAENPRLPKMLRQKEILDTIDQGVRDGIFVAALFRPDKSGRTWWRTPIDEIARNDPALEVFLPEKATLLDLHPSVIAPGLLPGLWSGEAVSVADMITYFSNARTMTTKRDGYEEPVAVPACPRAAVEAAISEAVRQGTLWLVNGPASFQGQQIPTGVLTSGARLRAPMSPLLIDRLNEDAVPEAWKDGQTTAYALSVALSRQTGHPIPWTVLRNAIDSAIKSRWLELVPGGPAWPCDSANASALILRRPAAPEFDEGRPGDTVPRPTGTYSSTADLGPDAFQDLVEALPDILRAAAGVPLRFQLAVTLGDGADIRPEVVASINEHLQGVNPDLVLKK